MVLLTITPLIQRGLKELEKFNHNPDDDDGQDVQKDATSEPSLSDPQIGKPISHGQIIDLSRSLKAKQLQDYSLESLLKGTKIYVPPPPPKPEPTSEYKALMARLRREEESRAYEQMIQPLPPKETFSQRFPATPNFDSYNSTEEDEITYSDINRQMTLILNVLISIICCSAALWIAARHWSTIARLSLSMSGSILVGVAEVVIYSGYMRRLGEAKTKEGKVKEVKEIMNTWIVGGDEKEENEIIVSGQGDEKDVGNLRNRGRIKNDGT